MAILSLAKREVSIMVNLSRIWTVLVTCILSVVVIAGIFSPAEATSALSPDMLAVQGHWVRSDAPYVIKLSHEQDGGLQAIYFNPRPINVGKTETTVQDGGLQILIELQDTNYPGSTYVLIYDRSQDVLQGIYFHPASQQSYEVSFVRQSAK
jgi:hypothetical protein